MKKKFFTGILVLGFFGSCYKAQVTQPIVEQVAPTTYKDDHIAIVDVKLQQTGTNEVTFSFGTQFEKELTKIEVYGGSSKSNICSFFEKTVAVESHELKTYTALNSNAGTQVNYYMIKYTTKAGNWSYSPLYKIVMK